jgi:hypothetical protein
MIQKLTQDGARTVKSVNQKRPEGHVPELRDIKLISKRVNPRKCHP